MISRIVIVGFPGAGKTTVGRKLANLINWDFKDVDTEFEYKYKFSIEHFFQNYGEEVFRKCEQQTLKDLLNYTQVVISCGGGTPCFDNNMDLIVNNSLSVYLQMDPQSLYDRLLNSKKKRPLLLTKSPEELQQYICNLLKIREEYYKKASLHVKGESIHITDLLNEINKIQKK